MLIWNGTSRKAPVSPAVAETNEIAQAAAAAIEALETSGRLSHSGGVEYRSARVFVPLENRLFRLATLMGHDYDNEGQIDRDGSHF